MLIYVLFDPDSDHYHWNVPHDWAQFSREQACTANAALRASGRVWLPAYYHETLRILQQQSVS